MQLREVRLKKKLEREIEARGVAVDDAFHGNLQQMMKETTRDVAVGFLHSLCECTHRIL